MGETREFLTATACKVGGGRWTGGYDISGHVFLLVLGSAFLWLEILPVVIRHAGLRERRLIRHSDGNIKNAESEGQPEGDYTDESKGAKGGVSVPLAVAGLSWWMLLMTAAYFHTWFEKVQEAHFHFHQKIWLTIAQFTGLLVAFIGIGTVYFLPRDLPAFRSVIGMPGV